MLISVIIMQGLSWFSYISSKQALFIVVRANYKILLEQCTWK